MSSTQVTDHLGRVQADAITTDSLVVGARGTDVAKEWTQITPTFTNYTVGAGTRRLLRYSVIGKTVFWSMIVEQSVEGTCGGNILLTLPVRAKYDSDDPTKFTVGSGILIATATFLCAARITSATTMEFLSLTGGTVVGPNGIGNGFDAVNPQLEAGWFFNMSGVYEAE